jgi:phosphoribosylamine--glycine ligase
MSVKTESNSNGQVNVLVLGSGGREHALCWKLAQSEKIERIFCAPGNGGTDSENKVENVPIAVDQFDNLIAFAKENKVALTVVGPDDPLANGVVDAFQAAGLKIFGPTQEAAKLESSKSYAKQFMVDIGIPTPRFIICNSLNEANKALSDNSWARVVKVDGLALGKGVFVCDSEAECSDALSQIFQQKIFGEAGEKVILEERIEGFEISLLMFCDGKTLVPMPASQDHKRRFDEDRGPNTGGMGVYAPMPNYEIYRSVIEHSIIEPLRAALSSGRLKFQGVIYAGIICGVEQGADQSNAGCSVTSGVQLLEFNARFGDPETQALMPLLQSDLYDVLSACVDQRLAEVDINWSSESSCCVVASAKQYPTASSRGKEIIIGALPPRTEVFQAGTIIENGTLKTNGGRVLSVNAVRSTLMEARQVAYQALQQIQFEDIDYRKDIARRALTQCLST